jgi:hypothetical protein
MQGAAPPSEGRAERGHPTPVSDTARLADSRPQSRPLLFAMGQSGVTKRVYLSSYMGAQPRGY